MGHSTPRAKPSRIGAAIRKHCLSYPRTEESFPWGESAFKVAGKTFVFTAKMPKHVIEFLVDESYRAVAPKTVAASLPEPPKLFL